MTTPSKHQRPLHCIHIGCATVGSLDVWDDGSFDALGGWKYYRGDAAHRFDGICPKHQEVSLGDSLKARYTEEHTVFEIHDGGELLGRVSFPTNTLRLQVHGDTANGPRLLAAGRVLATKFDKFLPDA